MRQMGIKAQWVKPYTITTIDSDFGSEFIATEDIFSLINMRKSIIKTG